jgi:hypothetical protein
MHYAINWYASLSDGTSRQEGKGQFEVREGEKSPWLRLLDYCAEKGLAITSLSLRSGRLSWNLPSLGRRPKFQAFDATPKPAGFRFFRKHIESVVQQAHTQGEVKSIDGGTVTLYPGHGLGFHDPNEIGRYDIRLFDRSLGTFPDSDPAADTVTVVGVDGDRLTVEGAIAPSKVGREHIFADWHALKDLAKSPRERYSVIEADYGDHALQVWVSHEDGASWTLMSRKEV